MKFKILYFMAFIALNSLFQTNYLTAMDRNPIQTVRLLQAAQTAGGQQLNATIADVIAHSNDAVKGHVKVKEVLNQALQAAGIPAADPSNPFHVANAVAAAVPAPAIQAAQQVNIPAVVGNAVNPALLEFEKFFRNLSPAEQAEVVSGGNLQGANELDFHQAFVRRKLAKEAAAEARTHNPQANQDSGKGPNQYKYNSSDEDNQPGPSHIPSHHDRQIFAQDHQQNPGFLAHTAEEAKKPADKMPEPEQINPLDIKIRNITEDQAVIEFQNLMKKHYTGIFGTEDEDDSVFIGVRKALKSTRPNLSALFYGGYVPGINQENKKVSAGSLLAAIEYFNPLVFKNITYSEDKKDDFLQDVRAFIITVKNSFELINEGLPKTIKIEKGLKPVKIQIGVYPEIESNGSEDLTKLKKNFAPLSTDLEKAINNALKAETPKFLSDAKFTSSLNLFLKRIQIQDQHRNLPERNFQGRNFTAEYKDLLELLGERGLQGALNGLNTIINSKEGVNTEILKTAASDWVKETEKCTDELKKIGHETLKKTNDKDAIVAAINTAAKERLSSLIEKKKKYEELLKTTKSTVKKTTQQSIVDAENAFFDIMARITFSIEKNKLSQQDKARFLLIQDDFVNKKVKSYQNGDSLADDFKKITAAENAYAEIMNKKNEELNPNMFDNLLSPEIQKNLEDLTIANNLITLMSGEKLPIIDYEFLSPSEQKDAIISRNYSTDGRLYTSKDKSPITDTIPVGLQEISHAISLVDKILGLPTNKPTFKFSGENKDKVVVAFCAPLVSNPDKDIFILNKLNDKNEIQIYINTDPLYKVNIDNATPGKIKELLFRVGLDTKDFDHNAKSFDKEKSAIRTKFEELTAKNFRDPRTDLQESMIYIIKRLYTNTVIGLETPSGKKDGTAWERILYKITSGK